MEYQKSFTGLRGFAFIQVLIFHYLMPIAFIPIGIFGVNLF
jgi:peptidoglycan/LPS O-acetylase OafA/YrhL